MLTQGIINGKAGQGSFWAGKKICEGPTASTTYLVHVISSNLVVTSQNFHLLHFFSALLCKEINFLVVSNEHGIQTITSNSNREV